MAEGESHGKVYTVSELTALIKQLVEGALGTVRLEGEISNFKVYSSGHAYFSLKDEGAQISAVMFKGDRLRVKFTPHDGMLVEVRGRLSVYPVRGQYQIIVSQMREAGQGALLAMLEERRRALAAEGLFDAAHKKALPPFPGTVGVVTSASGAAIRDILNVRRRRNPSVSVIVLPAAVQGEAAAGQIVAMIRAANRFALCDVLIVGRGGGSLEDLLPFSEERVVRAVYESAIPVISAVGHEIDWALCDYAADVRAPTPSAAAELAIPLKSDIVSSVRGAQDELYTGIRGVLGNLRLRLSAFSKEGMHASLQSIEQRYHDRYDEAYDALSDTMSGMLRDRRTALERCIQTLENCNPRAILDKGYAVIYSEGGDIVRDAAQLSRGERIRARLARGEARATVDDVATKEE